MKISRYIDVFGVSLFLILLTCFGRKLTTNSLPIYEAIPLFLLAFASGYTLADFLSGIAHWLADRYGSPELPLLGKHFILPFRLHHIHPKDITTHDFIELNGNSCITVSLFMIPTLLLPPIGFSIPLFFLTSTLLTLFFAIALTNQFHKYAHSYSAPAFIRLLQKFHLIIPHSHHNIHHKAPFETHYCITTGWLNKPLQKIQFFPRCEKLIYRLTGKKAGNYNLQELANKYPRQ